MPKLPRKKKVAKTSAGPYNGKKTSTQQQQSSEQCSSQDNDILNCDKCSRSVEQIIQCESCDKWYCGPCENIPLRAMELIGDYNQIHWFCQSCEVKVEQLGVQQLLVPNVVATQSSENISSNANVISSIISDALNKVVSQFTDALKETKAFIKTSIEEIVDAPTSMMDSTQQSEDQPASTSKPSKGQDVIAAVDEYVERERRKSNLIFHNLPEPENTETPDQKSLKDTQCVRDLVNKEFNLPNIPIKRVARLGAPKPSQPRPRLLLVELEDISIKRSILKQAVKLRNSSKWSNVYVSPDLTPKERKQNQLLRDELKSRRNAGEKDLYIKRGKIVSRQADAGSSARPSN